MGKTAGRVRVGRARRGQAGQSLLELALLTPLLLAMVLGAIELGRYAYLSILVGDAAHAGALYGSQNYIDAAGTAGTTQVCGNYVSGIQQAAYNDYQNNGQNACALTVTSQEGCGCDEAGTWDSLGTTTAQCSTSTSTGSGGIDPLTACPSQTEWAITVSVTTSATFRSLFNYPWIPNPLTITRTATMRVTRP